MLKKLLIVKNNLQKDNLKTILKDDFEIVEKELKEIDVLSLNNDKNVFVALIINTSRVDDKIIKFLNLLKEKEIFEKTPIMVIVEDNDKIYEEQALRMIVNDYFIRPLSDEELKQKIKNLVEVYQMPRLSCLIQRDLLTGLFTREAFLKRVEIMMKNKEAGYYTLSCFDIDSFKVINDQYGTQTGDEVLKYIAEIVNDFTTKAEGLCCRIMADNFAIFYPTKDKLVDKISEYHQRLLNPPQIGHAVSIRIGRYLVEDLTLSANAMYDRATLAVRSIKGCYDKYIAYYNESMRFQILKEQKIIYEMKEALRNKEFEVWFQPQYNHENSALVGAETLVRWKHPQKGLIMPSEFIPIFEKNGFIYEIDKYVLEKACECLRRWIDEGKNPMPLSVNISRYDIFCTDFVEQVVSIVKKYDLSPSLLRLEITESAFAQSTEQIVNIVKQLIDLGFTIEIDDFGSGYSSLNTLKNVPAQVIKLDVKFFQDTNDSQRGGNIIESVVRMSKWLGMSVIAEGVENRVQADFLKSVGCKYVQGFYYSKPMPEKCYEELFNGSETEKIKREIRQQSIKTIENLDNNMFWDPNSMDTLIFNTYVGSACIFEYENDKLEIIRTTDKFVQMINEIGISIDDALKTNWNSYLDEESKQSLKKSLEISTKTKEEFIGEYKFINLPTKLGFAYLRSSFRVIASADNRYLVYCTNENITAQNIAQQQAKKSDYEKEAISEQLKVILKNVKSGITAAVIENGKYRLLYTNDRFYETFGYTREEFNAKIDDAFNLILEEERKNIKLEYLNAYNSGESKRIEFKAKKKNGSICWVTAIVSCAKFSERKEKVQLSVIYDVTLEKEHERKIRENDEQLRFLNNAAHKLLSLQNGDEAIKQIFSNLLEYYGAERIYILEFKDEKNESEKIHEFRAKNVQSKIGLYKTISPKIVDFLIDRFKSKDSIVIRKLEDIPDTFAEKGKLKEHNVSSLIIVPLKLENTVKGIIGIDNPTLNADNIDRLIAISDYVVAMISKSEINSQMLDANKNLSGMMNDIPGGFVRIRLNENGKLVPTYINQGFRDLVGMEDDELLKLYSENVLAGVHPDDIKKVETMMQRLFKNGEAKSAKYRLLNGKGEYVWVEVFVRLTKNEDQETYVNAYYTNATTEKLVEEKQKELLDNLPFGAGLYEFDGKNITVIHHNKRFWELVNNSNDGKESYIENVAEEDKKILVSELQKAVKNGNGASEQIRLKCGNEGYKPFKIDCRFVLKRKGVYSIYATYSSIEDSEISRQQRLAVLFKSIMNTMSNLTFAKDTELKYICASKAFLELAQLKSNDEIVGKTDYDIFSKEIADSYRKIDEKVLSDGKAVLNIREIIPAKDNRVFHTTISKYRLADENGKIIGIYAVGEDITESTNIEKQLNLIADTISGGLASFEICGEKVRHIYFNEGFYNYSGYTREEFNQIMNENPFDLVFEEDIVNIIEAIKAFKKSPKKVSSCEYRGHTKSGGYRWLQMKGTLQDMVGDNLIVNVVQYDITEEKQFKKELERSKEEYRLAVNHCGNVICRYIIAEQTAYMIPEVATAFALPEIATNIPFGAVKKGEVSKETTKAYLDFFQKIFDGEPDGFATFEQKTGNGWRWFDARYSTVFDDSGKPISAIISFQDMTVQRNKEAIYEKWKQSISLKSPDSYTLFRCNLSKNVAFDSIEGMLLQISFGNGTTGSFNEITKQYANSFVFKDDREEYIKSLDCDTLLANYYRGNRINSFDYREVLSTNSYRWLNRTIELVEFPNSTDIMAYLMYINIDEEKKRELEIKALAEKDTLTGIYNRHAFTEKMNLKLKDSNRKSTIALLMLDIDNFKLVNDSFGHPIGDETLIDVANKIQKQLRYDDLIGRLGGDEFVVCLSGNLSKADIGKKAMAICEATKKQFSIEVQISTSIGIAICPEDGCDFETLYKKADLALYHIKMNGKSTYAFYEEMMLMEKPNLDAITKNNNLEVANPTLLKRRMLIVDDNKINRDMLNNIFKDDFIVDMAEDGNDALLRMRQYGSTISIVLLDLVMPELDGFEVLAKIKEIPELQSIPVIVVSGMSERETSLRVIRSGASDFVTKPIDPELLKIRIESAISKTENERLRMQTNDLIFKSRELAKLKTFVESTNTVIMEYDVEKDVFSFDKDVSLYLFGKYDNRSLWQVLESEEVAAKEDVLTMKVLITQLLKNNDESEKSFKAKLKTPSGDYHMFKIRIIKNILISENNNSLILSFSDLEND